jgi:lipopolysaccharide/colanic/teichoic acid biosynthesis glycosyltransferase
VPVNDPSMLVARLQDTQAPAFLAEKPFLRSLCLERRRAERSRKSILLVLIREHNSAGQQTSDRFGRSILGAVPALAASIRETDIHGWYRNGSIYGIVFTEFNNAARKVIQSQVSHKLTAALGNSLDGYGLSQLLISFHFYPESESGDGRQTPVDRSLYPDLTAREDAVKFSRATKRFLDILGSVLGIVLLSPVFATIALLIKLNSRGPVFFKQMRVGQYGSLFSFLKFRSMSSWCDGRIHEDYVKRYISGGEGTKQTTANGEEAYKLTQDPRVTRIGRFLRKTSLDELPQLFNVLKGDMSLVGPRPPIPYELEAYDIWHMRRLLEARPGITGLWQVTGRSRTTFDEMVRLDLRYAKTWSLWLDFKILLRTPGAVLSGNGAY